MIRIHKPADPPDILVRRGKPKRRGMSAAVTRNPADYLSGARTFEFESAIYGAKSVKTALKKAQHGKCAFCESKVAHVAYGDVEHFRPKKGYMRDADSDLERPGYYWLAYEWDNLLFSCQICNQREKRNLFPLADENNRARTHKDDFREESPMFIHPGEEDPSPHVTFKEEVIVPVNGSPRGMATINGLGLDRDKVEERRREELEPIKLLYRMAFSEDETLADEAADSRAFLKALLANPAQQYSAMFRTAIESWGGIPATW